MNPRQKKRVIYLTGACVALGAVGVLAAGFMSPVTVAPKGSIVKSGSTRGPGGEGVGEGVVSKEDGRSLAWLREVCSIELRRPLFDPPPPPPPPKDQQRTVSSRPMTVRLVGMVYEPGHSMAVFQKPDGTRELCAEGESIDDAGGQVTVKKVEMEKVIVEYGGQSHELIPPPKM